MWPLVYINLDRDVQRRERMEALLSGLPFSYSRLPGVLWSALSPQEQARLYSPSLNAKQFFRPLVDGEKGCYASHLRACEQLLEIQAPALIVLEDDVTLDTCLVEVLDALAARSVGNWDVVKLYSRDRERTIDECSLTSSHRLVTYKRVPSMCNGYILSRSGARKLLQNRRPFGRPVDVDMRYWWECDLRVLGIVPAVVTMGPMSLESSIWNTDRPRRRWVQRWRRWGLQVDYSVRNAWYSRLPAPLTADHAP